MLLINKCRRWVLSSLYYCAYVIIINFIQTGEGLQFDPCRNFTAATPKPLQKLHRPFKTVFSEALQNFLYQICKKRAERFKVTLQSKVIGYPKSKKFPCYANILEYSLFYQVVYFAFYECHIRKWCKSNGTYTTA